MTSIAELHAENERLKKLMAIQAEQITIANERGDYWKGACEREMRLAFSLTDCVSHTKLDGNTNGEVPEGEQG